ncbi:MAG: hypothetical protein JWQ74_366 [Marmoricola sp.]|nr:hypothetical protein [Marmoricola sp.]
MDYARAHYDDGSIACDETGVAIQRYYPWGPRRIRYGEIRDVSVLRLDGRASSQPWRIWGPTDLEHWWNLDSHRQARHVALVIDTGERFKPTVTPTDPDGFERVIRAHLNGVARLREVAAEARLASTLTADPTPLIPAQRSDADRAQRLTRSSPRYGSVP